MNVPSDSSVDDKVLLATARIQAALYLASQLVGPKQVWGPWLRDRLEAELSQLSRPTTSAPHSRLLGSLERMLLDHDLAGMTINTLRFDQVRADDPQVTGTEHVQVPAHVLPPLDGTNFWWNALPPSVSLNTAPSISLKSLRERIFSTPSGLEFKLRSGQNQNVPQPEVTGSQRGSTSKEAGSARTTTEIPIITYKSQGLTAREEGAPQSKKRKIIEWSDSDSDDDVQTRYSACSNLREKPNLNVDVPVQPSSSTAPQVPNEQNERELQVCDACKSHNSVCVWPNDGGPLASRRKRACKACASRKSRCGIAGVFSILRPRVKPQENTDDLRHLLTKLRKRVVDLEKRDSINDANIRKYVDRISNLELQLQSLSDMH